MCLYCMCPFLNSNVTFICRSNDSYNLRKIILGTSLVVYMYEKATSEFATRYKIGKLPGIPKSVTH